MMKKKEDKTQPLALSDLDGRARAVDLCFQAFRSPEYWRQVWFCSPPQNAPSRTFLYTDLFPLKVGMNYKLDEFSVKAYATSTGFDVAALSFKVKSFPSGL